MDLLKIINEILEEEGLETVEVLTRELELKDDLKLDSMMLAELTVKIEDETGIDIFEDGVVRTIGEIMDKLGE